MRCGGSSVTGSVANIAASSPTFVLNEERQKLYGNFGYRVIEASVHELLAEPGERASWC
jgi:hypothetical protein